MPASEIVVDILIDPHITSPVAPEEICQIVTTTAKLRGFQRGQIGVRVTTNTEIHRINHTHLQHDYPTDVISFDYGSSENRIEGELVVSVETAEHEASVIGWSSHHELTLYLVHGTLHIAGMDDQQASDRLEMRQAEHQVLAQLGIDLRKDFSPDGGLR